jgi:hypothetical protein
MGSGLGPVHRSTRPIEMLLRVQFCTVFKHMTVFQRIQYSCILDPLKCYYMFNFVQFLNTWQYLNESNVLYTGASLSQKNESFSTNNPIKCCQLSELAEVEKVKREKLQIIIKSFFLLNHYYLFLVWNTNHFHTWAMGRI